tara:strand:- start:391 stop:921 length:531 start_codon:yes stop_codon:yes gene_type:complete
MRIIKMNKELLSMLLPKSQTLEKSSGSNNAITVEDINLILSYAKLSKEEYNFLLMKFVSADTYKSSFVGEVALRFCDIEDKKNEMLDFNMLNKLINLAVVESCEPKCVFCKGTGTLITLDNISDCPHCVDGIFTFTDQIRCHLLKIKSFTKFKKKFAQIKNLIDEIEISALSKIGE